MDRNDNIPKHFVSYQNVTISEVQHLSLDNDIRSFSE